MGCKTAGHQAAIRVTLGNKAKKVKPLQTGTYIFFLFVVQREDTASCRYAMNYLTAARAKGLCICIVEIACAERSCLIGSLLRYPEHLFRQLTKHLRMKLVCARPTCSK